MELTDYATSTAEEKVPSYDVQMQSTVCAKKYCDETTQACVNIVTNMLSETFTCDRYVYLDLTKTSCEVAIQTDMNDGGDYPVEIPNRKRYEDFEGNTPIKTFEHKLVGSSIPMTEKIESQYFSGIKSVKNDDQLSDLTGVTFANFKFLLKRLEIADANNRQVSKEDRLFMFLIKIKTFSAMSVISCKDRTTISKIFYSSQAYLARSTADLVFWPHKQDVQRTMPACFRPEFSNTRVILDCTGFRVESPARVDDRVFTYSHNKKGFTAKLLVGITPSGFISYESKVAGGRKSDSQITVESGLLDLLEDNDVVLADEGFPRIQTALDEKGSKVLLIMPPFLENKSEFTAEETGET